MLSVPTGAPLSLHFTPVGERIVLREMCSMRATKNKLIHCCAVATLTGLLVNSRAWYIHECTIVPGRGKDSEEQKWIDLNWGNAINGTAGIHYLLNPSLLAKDATIVEIGAFEGRDIELFLGKQPSGLVHIHAYEPVQEQFQILASKMAKIGNGQVTVYPYGLSSHSHATCFLKAAEGTYDSHTTSCTASSRGYLHKVTDELKRFKQIDLLHVNCEGCEYATLKTVLTNKRTSKHILKIEVQFHEVITHEQYCEIERLLVLRGFRLKYRYQYVWEAWVR